MAKKIEISEVEQRVLDALREVRAKGHNSLLKNATADDDGWIELHRIVEILRMYSSTPATVKALTSLEEKGLVVSLPGTNPDGSRAGRYRITAAGESFVPRSITEATERIGATRYDIVAVVEQMQEMATTLGRSMKGTDDEIANAIAQVNLCARDLETAAERWRIARHSLFTYKSRYGLAE